MENHIKVGLGIMIIDNNKILLGHRSETANDTGGIYEPGSWTIPGGKQEYNETMFEGAIRETKEETNLDISYLEIFSASDDIQSNKHYVTINIIAHKYSGELKNMEPTKHSEWKWFDLNNLPENLYLPAKKFIEKYLIKNQTLTQNPNTAQRLRYGELYHYVKENQKELVRKIIYTNESFFNEPLKNKLANDVYFKSPKYKVISNEKTLFEHYEYPQFFIKEITTLSSLLGHFCFNFLTNDTLYTYNAQTELFLYGYNKYNPYHQEIVNAFKTTIFNGKYAYEHCELFGYERKNPKLLIPDIYNIDNYRFQQETDLTKYWSILTTIDYNNPSQAFIPQEIEGPILERNLLRRNEND